MKDFTDKVAFITGGGSGVGLGQAKVFGAAGCRVVIADIRGDHLQDGLSALQWLGINCHGIRLDITDRAAYARAADETEEVFGPVELLFNTAGVSLFGPLEKSTYDDYDWQMNVNIGGVVNGIVTFVPRMIAHGRGGYIVNTASMGAFHGSDPAGIYCATKFAVLGLTEALRGALEKYDIGVSVLCPANVNSNIAEAIQTRPEKYGDSGYKFDDRVLQTLKTIYAAGKDPEDLARELMDAMARNQFYVIPYPEARTMLRARFDQIISSLPPEDYDVEGVAKRAAAMKKYREQRAQMKLDE